MTLMTGIPQALPAELDWTNRDEVVRYARGFKSRMTVYQHPDRPNLNITHTSRTDQYRPEWVVAHV